MAPTLTVIVPLRDEARVLARTLPSILAQDLEDVEFLLVDGRSTDGTQELVHRAAAEDRRIRVLDNPVQTLAGALQVGMAEARGSMIAKMDAHTYFPAHYLSQAVERLARGDVHWVSGPAIPFGEGPGSQAVAAALGTRLGIGGSAKWPASAHGGRLEEWELDTGVFSGVIDRSTLERIGAWDPDWPVNEDSELASRFLEAGERILCVGTMGARYVPREELRGLARQWRRYGFYRVKTARRHPASMRPSHLLPSALVLVLAGALCAPAPLRPPAQLGLAAYGAALAYGTATAPGAVPGAAWRLPSSFAVMHLGFGFGWLAGCVRFGVPIQALWRIARRRSGRWGDAACALGG